MAATAGVFEILLVLLLGGGVLPLPVGVPPLPEDPALLTSAPAETILFMEWFGIGETNPASTNATERLAAEEELRSLVETVVEAVKGGMQEEMGRELGVVAGEILPFLSLVASRPGCVFVSGVTLPPQEPSVSGGIVINAGEKASELGRFMRELENLVLSGMGRGSDRPAMRSLTTAGSEFRAFPLPPMVPQIAWGFAGRYLVLAVGPDMPEKIVAGLNGRAGLSAQQEFRTLSEKVSIPRPTGRYSGPA